MSKRLTFKKKLSIWLAATSFVVLLVWMLSFWYLIAFNITNSVNGFVFLIEKNVVPEKGEMVAFWPPPNDWYPHTWFVKYVRGVAGDEVTRVGQEFFINDEYIGDAKSETSGGKPIKASQAGIIPSNEFFAWTPNPNSFDSRYEQIGLVHTDRVIGRAYRIF